MTKQLNKLKLKQEASQPVEGFQRDGCGAGNNAGMLLYSW